ncbi:MBL fold metallo-hydrolase [bacterium]|nr:MBL fold metallo-hydrolase [bacterium]
MKNIRLIFILSIICVVNYVLAQETVELQFKPLDSDFIQLIKSLEEIDQTDDNKSIELCINALKKYKDPNIRYDLIYWELAFHYAGLEQYDKCFEILQKGQDEGLYYFIREGDDAFPPFLEELEKKDGYRSFLENNELLKTEANTASKTEYMIQLPEEYDNEKEYPLFLVMHGGNGSIPALQYNYMSPKLEKEFIVAYFQGSVKQGTNARSFSRDWGNIIKDGFKRVVQKYAVDTSKVILAGPSAGGIRSIILGMKNIIPAKGLLLSYSMAFGLDSLDYINSAERGLKIALLCGENDMSIKQQKELGCKFDKYGITNRFIIFPDKGHEFPNNWQHHLDTSLEFLFKEDDSEVKNVEITYIANEGFLIETGGKKILIDALFGHREYSWCMIPDTQTKDAMLNNQGMFQDIDIIATTHEHPDHVYPPYVVGHLLNNQKVTYVSSEQSIAQLKALMQYDDIARQVVNMTPDKRSYRDTTISGIDIRIYRIAHGPYWTEDPTTGKKVNRHKNVQNLAFLFTIDGVKIFHTGDANEDCIEDFKRFRLDKEEIDVALINGGFMWEMGCSGIDLMERYIKADHIIMMHLHSDEYALYKSIADSLKKSFPSIKVFKDRMERVTYSIR